MDAFVNFMATPIGRGARIVIGIILVVVGIMQLQAGSTLVGIIVALIGLVPIYAGAANVCLIAPLLGKK